MILNKKNAILIGDYSKAKYHPLKNIDQELCNIFCDEIMIQCTEDYDMLCIEHLNKFDLCISYVDCWDEKVSKKQAAGLLAFVSCGGGLLVIHNGISLQNSYEIAQMIGAKFTGHPPGKKLKFQISAPDHAIMEGISEFEIEEEPYQFVFDTFTQKTTLLEYKQQDKQQAALCQAAWAHEFGEGRVVYLMPGHDINSFKNSIYRQMILRSGKWASKLI